MQEDPRKTWRKKKKKQKITPPTKSPNKSFWHSQHLPLFSLQSPAARSISINGQIFNRKLATGNNMAKRQKLRCKEKNKEIKKQIKFAYGLSTQVNTSQQKKEKHSHFP